jgi:DNA-binding NarL/FixJ family response regulator
MAAHGRIRSVPGQHLLLEQLTDRELQVLQLVAAGRRNRQIAEALKVSVKTVEFHLSNILGKLGAQSRTEAVVRAWQSGILRPQAS